MLNKNLLFEAFFLIQLMMELVLYRGNKVLIRHLTKDKTKVLASTQLPIKCKPGLTMTVKCPNSIVISVTSTMMQLTSVRLT